VYLLFTNIQTLTVMASSACRVCDSK